MALKIPKLSRSFNLGEGRVGNRGLAYNLKGAASRGQSMSDMRYRNLSKTDISTITENLKPFEEALKKRGGLSRNEAIRARDLMKKEYDKYRSGKGTFTREDYNDAKEIVESLKKSNQEKPQTEEQPKPTAKSIINRPGIYNPNRDNTPLDVHPPNTYGSISQMLRLRKTGNSSPSSPPPKTSFPRIKLPF